MAWRTSATPAQRTMAAGWRSIAPFQTARASSYSGWSGRISSPRRDSSSSCREASPTTACVAGFIDGPPRGGGGARINLRGAFLRPLSGLLNPRSLYTGEPLRVAEALDRPAGALEHASPLFARGELGERQADVAHRPQQALPLPEGQRQAEHAPRLLEVAV